MQPRDEQILILNGGSSSLKFALFSASSPLTRMLDGKVERIGLPEATLVIRGGCYKEDGTATTPSDVTVLNELDRFHLAREFVDRLTQHGSRGANFKVWLSQKLIEHRAYVERYGDDLAEVSEWRWEAAK